VAKVIRQNKPGLAQRIKAKELVPGDIVEVAGNVFSSHFHLIKELLIDKKYIFELNKSGLWLYKDTIFILNQHKSIY
jgi:hypothetical protein